MTAIQLTGYVNGIESISERLVVSFDENATDLPLMIKRLRLSSPALLNSRVTSAVIRDSEGRQLSPVWIIERN